MASESDMGASVFYEMSAKLKRAGQGDLRKQFHKEMREAAKPLLPAVRKSAAARFPRRGGLNEHMARGGRYRTVAKTGAATAGVSIRADRTDPRTDSQGRIWHPVPQTGGTKVAAHTVETTSVKTRKTRRKHVAASVQGGEVKRDEKGRRVGTVQMIPRAKGYFRDPIEAGADEVRRELLAGLDRWVGQVLGG